MKEKANYSPILEGLLSYKEQQTARFHVPGHKGSWEGVPSSYRDPFVSVLGIDVTELSGLDDLHAPQEMIAEAQRLAADCFQAEQTYFLVNGSTVGNLAMILATLERGEQVLVQRNSHKSVFHALTLVEAEAILLEPAVCPTFQVPLGLELETVQEALKLYPRAKALILTSPNYYGMITPDLQQIITFAHEKGCVVLIDEAHGAHFGQEEALPRSAMQVGADASVQSTHKMLSSMTMTSMLHVQGERIDRTEIEYYLHTLQSSSPSYPLLASLDVARLQLQQLRAQDWLEMIQQTIQLRHSLVQLRSYTVSNVGLDEGKQQYTSDPFKLIIQPRWGLSGYQLQERLEEHGIYVELADPLNVLLALPLWAQHSWGTRLVQALVDIAKDSEYGIPIANRGEGVLMEGANKSSRALFHSKAVGQTRPKKENSTEANAIKAALPHRWSKNKIKTLQMRKYKRKELEEISMEQAEGRRIAEQILPYPPGIPLCLPNELITAELISEIKMLQQQGAYFQGKPNDFATLLVVRL